MKAILLPLLRARLLRAPPNIPPLQNMQPPKESVHAGRTIAEHANLHAAAKWLQCRMRNAPAELQKTFATATITHPKVCLARQKTVTWLRGQQNRLNWNTLFREARELEDELTPFFTEDSKQKEDLENDALAQLSFQTDFFKPLNYIPFALTAITLFKIWVVPTMAVLTPLIAWVLPYILLKFVYALPIQHEEYTQILQSFMSGDVMNFVRGSSPAGAVGGWSNRSIGQMIIFGFSFLQSMIQPVQNAMHLYKIDKTFCDIGEKLVYLGQLARMLRTDLKPAEGPHTKISHALDTLPEHDFRAAFILVKEQPQRLKLVLRDMARIEILWRIAQQEQLQPVQFSPERLELKGVVDISLFTHKVPSSVSLQAGEQPHAVLTGPNGGGKSSFMRGVLQAVLFGHTFGVAPARSATMPYFRWIASGLQLRDTPGKLSMFETEVKFAADVLKSRNPDGPGLVLFDELFHSTNPGDGVRTSKRFLDALWRRGDIFSIVSTHVYSLIEAAPKTVQPICCKAVRLPDSAKIHYFYAVEPGICRVSSVDKVWDKFGLRPASPGQTLESEEKHAD